MTYNLTIDPGVGGMGVAYWDASQWGDYVVSYKNSAVIHHDQAAIGFMEKAKSVTDRLRTLVHPLWVSSVWIEYPEYYETKGGKVTAESGSLVKLSVLTGMVTHVFLTHPSHPRVVWIPPSSWKGQLKKDVTKKRLIARASQRMLSDLDRQASHAWDAVGMGVKLQEIANGLVATDD